MALSNRVDRDISRVTCHSMAAPTATRKRLASIQVMSMGATTLCTTCRPKYRAHDMRSEEHTSELQSHSDLVCRLLLEKKKSYRRRWMRIAARARRGAPRAVSCDAPIPVRRV